MIKRAGIYDPYLDTLGGGDRYCLTVAEILSKNGYNVDVFWNGDPDLIKKASIRFSLDLDKISIAPDIFGLTSSKLEFFDDELKLPHQSSITPHSLLQKSQDFINKINTTKQYDLIFYLSDGSLPFLFAKKNLLHIQVPFIIKQKSTDKLINKIKFNQYQHIVCNSAFTQRITEQSYNTHCTVLYPPVDVAKFNSTLEKEKIILSVGRFDNILNAKKQDVLIEAFKQLNLSGWKLVLAGGSLENPDKNHYLQHLQRLAEGYNIEFLINVNFNDLKKIYALSTIYWHAAGFGVDENICPEQTEHFGMAPVEAMASGSVPIVVAKGGLTEIVDDGIDGYLWSTISELVTKTNNLIHDPILIKQLSLKAIEKSQLFTKEKFASKLLELINQ